MKPGIAVDIPGFGRLELGTVASDYTGTLSRGGKVSDDVRGRLVQLAGLVDIHILTADTFGTADRELVGLPVTVHRLDAMGQDVQKTRFVEKMNAAQVVAFGNGNNDRLFLGAVKKAGGLAVAIDNGEGCAMDTLQNANLFIVGAENALDLLIETNRLKATLRF
jgi:soluble P-type ATPase